jgi:hypothetical protein
MATISLGVAFAQDDVAPEIVAKWADDALYDAKRGGRNIVFLSNTRATTDDARRAQQPHSPGISTARSTRMMS